MYDIHGENLRNRVYDIVGYYDIVSRTYDIVGHKEYILHDIVGSEIHTMGLLRDGEHGNEVHHAQEARSSQAPLPLSSSLGPCFSRISRKNRYIVHAI